VLLTALLVAAIPLATLAANPFTDLVSGSVHNQNIDAIYNAGITTGCVPNQSYCPTDLVTRQEMASFLARTAGLGGNPAVANAKTAETATNATNAQNAVTAQQAGNANTVGGYAPNGLVRVARGTGANAQPLGNTLVAVATVTITAPAAGFVLVTSSVSIQTGSGSSCYAQTLLRDATGGVSAGPNYSFLAAPGEEQLASPTYVFPVTAGARTLQLQARMQQASCTASAYMPVITALYVPFGSTGATTLDLPDVPSPEPHSGPGSR